MSDAPVGRGPVAIVGAGPGVGAAVARRFGAEGHSVGLVARTRERVEALAADLRDEGLHVAAATADARRPDEVRAALAALAEALGPVEVLCFSPLPDVGLIHPVAETSAEDLAAGLELGVVGGAAAVGAVLPGMRERGAGTLLATTGGAAVRPNHERAMSAVVGAAQTVYARMLHEALAPEGIHAAQVTIVGPVGPGRTHEPEAVAAALWRCHAERGEALVVLE